MLVVRANSPVKTVKKQDFPHEQGLFSAARRESSVSCAAPFSTGTEVKALPSICQGTLGCPGADLKLNLEGVRPYEWWDIVQHAPRIKAFTELIDFGRRAVQFSASEAECERLFCHFPNLIGDCWYSTKPDFLKALPAISRAHHCGVDSKTPSEMERFLREISLEVRGELTAALSGSPPGFLKESHK
jgi:hypothetical protein